MICKTHYFVNIRDSGFFYLHGADKKNGEFNTRLYPQGYMVNHS